MEHKAQETQLAVGVRLLDCDHREMAEAIMELQAGAAPGMDQGRRGPASTQAGCSLR